MGDIGRLESRVQNIEFYTQLSLLETETAIWTSKSDTGLDRFKSGFFVDNFKSHGSHDIVNKPSDPYWQKLGELRPSHYTTAYDLWLDQNKSLVMELLQIQTLTSHKLQIFRQCLQRTGDRITWSIQRKSSSNRSLRLNENVNPFAVINWVGIIQLNQRLILGSTKTPCPRRLLKKVTITPSWIFEHQSQYWIVSHWLGCWEETWTGSKSTTQDLVPKQLQL